MIGVGVSRHLSDVGLKVGDFVAMSNDKETSGGIIYQIVEDTEPVTPAKTRQKIVSKQKVFDLISKQYELKDVEETVHGFWDVNGKKIMTAAVYGFVRIKPIFNFFALERGLRSTGKRNTTIVYYSELSNLKLVDAVSLGSKYVELGNLIRDMMMSKTQ
jgi:hypothetical protein